MSQPRVGPAVALAPLSALLPFALLAPFADRGWMLPFVGLCVAVVSYAGMILVGIPVFALFMRFGLLRWWQFTLTGMAIPGLLVSPGGVGAALLLGLFGGLVAWVAWFIAFHRIPGPEADIEGPGGPKG